MKAPTHGIADIVLTDGPSALFCCCGWDGAAATPEALNDAFQDHRVSVGERRRSFSSSEMSAPEGGSTWRDNNTIRHKPEDREVRRERTARPEPDDHLRELWRGASKRYRDRRKAVAA